MGRDGVPAPIMYRNQDWYDGFAFWYDMSVPNVAHLDPQRGGCCTIFPYFIGDIVELPLTTTQDYPLYNILRVDALDFWVKQLKMIVSRHGLASFIIHPDYTMDSRSKHFTVNCSSSFAGTATKRAHGSRFQAKSTPGGQRGTP